MQYNTTSLTREKTTFDQNVNIRFYWTILIPGKYLLVRYSNKDEILKKSLINQLKLHLLVQTYICIETPFLTYLRKF